MKTINRLLAAVCICLALSGQKISAQHLNAGYVFTQDSISGFDEAAAKTAALANNCFGKEFQVYMYRAMRTYVNQKYQIESARPNTTLYNNPLLRPAPVPGGACNNEDFELGNVQGWTLQSGLSNNSCAQPTLTGSSLYTVITGPYADSRVTGNINSYFDAASINAPAGNNFIRLNDDQAGAKAVRLSKSFIPTPNSAVFQYAFLAVIEDGSHDCCDQAGFNIKVTVTNTTTNASTLLACPQISVAVPGALCNFTVPPGGPSFSPCVGTQGAGWSYCNWTASALDLSPYLNYMVQIDVTVVDCAFGGHGAYFYFDAKCSPMTITGNSNSFPAGTPSVTVPTCGASGATICATPGLGPYWWAGPGVNAPFNAPSMSNQCFITNLSATYTLYMQPPGSCAPLTRVITTTNTPAPLLLISAKQAGCGDTTAVVSVTPSGSAAQPSYINWFPSPLTISTNSTVGTYTLPPLVPKNVTVTASDPLGCVITQTIDVNPAPPAVSFTIVNLSNSQSITCITPSVVLDIATNYTYGTLSYFWASNTNTYTTASITITTAPQTPTCIGTDPVTNCSFTQAMSVGINTTAPSTTVTPMFQNITCNLTSITTVSGTTSPSVNIMQYIVSPFGGTLSANSHTMVYLPPMGNPTHCAVDLVNGCSTCKVFTITSNQGFPTFSIVSTQSLGCNTKSCTSVAITNAATSPVGGPVSYTILAPGSSTSTPSGPLSANSVYTVCAPGTYTVITKDNTSACETRVPLSILQNTFAPALQVVVPLKILDCNNPRVTLKASSNISYAEYNWGFTGVPGNSPGDTLTVFANTGAPNSTLTGNYTVTATDPINTCKSNSVITINQSLFTPNVVIAGAFPLTCTTPTLILTNQSTSRVPVGIGFPTNNAAVAKRWDGPTPQEPAYLISTYFAQTPGIYTLTAQDMNNGCIATGTTFVADNKVFPNINNPVVPPPSILDCGNETTKLAPIITTNTQSLVYYWTAPANAKINGQTSATLVTNMVGEYKVLVTDTKNGCRSSAIMSVVPGTLTANFEMDQESGFAPMTVNFTNLSSSSLGNDRIKSVWSLGNGINVTYSNVASVQNVYSHDGSYTVTLFTQKGECLSQVSKVIRTELPSQVETPNIFTPNGDGINDLYFLKTTNLVSIDFVIYDRWGKKVYELTAATGNIAWDGKNQRGVEVSEGTYFFVAKCIGLDGAEFNEKGTITLVR